MRERLILIVGYSDDSRYPIGSEVETEKGRFVVTNLTRADSDNWYVWGRAAT